MVETHKYHLQLKSRYSRIPDKYKLIWWLNSLPIDRLTLLRMSIKSAGNVITAYTINEYSREYKSVVSGLIERMNNFAQLKLYSI